MNPDLQKQYQVLTAQMAELERQRAELWEQRLDLSNKRDLIAREIVCWRGGDTANSAAGTECLVVGVACAPGPRLTGLTVRWRTARGGKWSKTTRCLYEREIALLRPNTPSPGV